MARFRFTHDSTLYHPEDDDRVIETMIIEEHPWGETILGRKRSRDGKWLYAMATWDNKAGQFRSGKWFAGGRSYSSFEYVCSWSPKIPSAAR